VNARNTLTRKEGVVGSSPTEGSSELPACGYVWAMQSVYRNGGGGRAPPDVRDWPPEGHLAWVVLHAVAGMNLREFYAAYRDDGVGRRTYDPAAMVPLLLCGDARGVR